MNYQEVIKSIKPLDTDIQKQAQERRDNLTCPLGALGTIGDLIVQLAGIQKTVKPSIGKKVLTVFAGDHGITDEGVSAYPKEVTPQMVMNFVAGGACVNVLCRHEGAEVQVADIGMAIPVDTDKILQRNVRRGTANFAQGPAMTREEAIKAIETGMEIAKDQIAQGATLLATGEMGIGNTTPSAAILSVFTGVDPEEVTGRGTGVDDAGLAIKIAAIRKGIKVNSPDPKDPIDVLSKVGGLEIAAIAGYILEAAAESIPVVVDGFISTAGALVACKLSPVAAQYIIPSHGSQECGHLLMLEQIGLAPILQLKMRVGEGNGAALAMNIIDAACKIQSEMATFADAGVSNKD